VATPAMSSTAMSGTSATTKSNRGKDQIQWGDDVWKTLDEAVTDEMMRTRVGAKFLPQVHVPKKQTNVESDIVVIPGPPTGTATFDAALSVDESETTRVQEYWTTFFLSVAQVESEEQQELQSSNQTANSSAQGQTANGQGSAMSRPHRASTACSLALRAANILAQAEDLVLFGGQNAVVNSPLFTGKGGIAGGPLIQFLDPHLSTDLDFGLLNIQSVPATGGTLAQNVIMLPATQVIAVHPVQPTTGTPPTFPFLYRENTLNAVAQGFSALQANGHYENYALVLHTFPYADLHQALPTTLIEPVEPVSHLVKAGIYGTGTMPPFTPVIADTPGTPQPVPSGLPTAIVTSLPGAPLQTTPVAGNTQIIGQPIDQRANVLYTGVLVSLSGNTMDQVRGLMDDSLDALVTFNQKDQNEKYRFRVVQRHCLRLKDPSAVILFLFLDI
jgi:hypothetical protein